MNTTTRRFPVLLVTLVLLAVLFGVGTFFVLKEQIPQQLSLGSAFKAKTLAAGLFVQGLELKRLEAEDSGFNFLFNLLWADVDRENQAVTVSLLGTGAFSAKAIRVPGLGAILLAGRDEPDVRELKPAELSLSTSSGSAASQPWPQGDGEDGRPLPVALDKAALDYAVNQTFLENDPSVVKRTRAVVVLVGGKIVAEQYAGGISAQTRLLSWSMAKSFTNVLVGMAAGQGLLDIRAPAPVPEWPAGDPRAAITTDQLMRMSSGLSFFEDYTDNPISDVNQMLFLEPDFASFAARQPLAAAPDTVWNYSSGSSHIVSRILRKVIGNDTDYWNFSAKNLFGPLGMASAEWGADATGTLSGGSYLYATARDYARFGLFCLQDGVWQGKRLLPEGWMAYAITPTKTNREGQYGSSFWLNGGQFADLPADLVWVRGHDGQAIFFSQSLDLVVVRLGMTWKGDWGAGELLSGIRRSLGK